MLPIGSVTLAGGAAAQQATDARTVRQAYGSRLTGPDLTADDKVTGVVRRLDQRINARVENRLSLRIERYSVAVANPVAAYRQDADHPTGRGSVPTVTAPGRGGLPSSEEQGAADRDGGETDGMASKAATANPKGR